MKITTGNGWRPERHTWTPARVYAAYRLILTTALFLLFELDLPAPLGNFQPELFRHAILAYLILALATPPLEHFVTADRHWSWILWPLVGDVILLTLLIHASGGLESPMTALLMVTVAAANILLPGRRGLLITALAAIAVLFEQFYYALQVGDSSPFQLTGAGLLGLSLFVVSLIVRQIAERLARSEELTAHQQLEIRRLEELNRHIVQRMRTGILVFDPDMRVLVSNRSARNLFGGPLEGKPVPEQLMEDYRRWRANPTRTQEPVFLSPAAQAMNVGFARLDDNEDSPVIAFLEDHARVVQEAQQLKLASLGRMSATIAHEIRNPLSAIRHAAALLAETSRSEDDSRLLTMIENHVERVDAIINDVLDLSRRPAGAVSRRPLKDVVNEVRENWLKQGLSPGQFRVLIAREDVEIRFDMLQLVQVLDNLTRNALHHGGQNVRITVEIGIHESTGLPRMVFCDDGPGVPETVRPNLFEPFFTTDREGTGLGLFICRELCEANQARLDYEDGHPGACFVITFSHPQRVFE